MRALDLDNAHPDDSPERRDHVVRRGGCAEHRQNLGDEELGLFRNSRENRTSFNGRLNISNGLARRGSDI
jgi:hypothetical protein